jgi:hypothetical protein
MRFWQLLKSVKLISLFWEHMEEQALIISFQEVFLKVLPENQNALF